MKTIDLNEFKKLVESTGWNHEQEHEVTGGEPAHDGIARSWGWYAITSTRDDIKIVYTGQFAYEDYNEDSLTIGPDENFEGWKVEGVEVVYDHGDEDKLDAYDLSEYLPEDFTDFDADVLNLDETDDTDIDEDSDMKTITLIIDNEPNIRFTGELIAEASSTDDKARGYSYSGETGRWTDLRLYKTAGGKYVCHNVGRTRWQGEKTRYSGKVCETLDEVREYFGHRWLAKELYEEAGIDDVTEVE